MIKFFVFATVGLCAALFGTATAANQCYVNPINDIENGNYDNILTQNCNQYLRDISPGFKLRRNVPIHCFTMRFEGPDDKFKLKGCIPRGQCNAAKAMYMDRIRALGVEDYINRVTCSECYGDNCNGN